MTRRTNAEIIFRALSQGLVVEKGLYRYVIKERNFGVLGYDGTGDVFLGLDWPLSSFIRWCDSQFMEEEIVGIAANITLNELQRKR